LRFFEGMMESWSEWSVPCPDTRSYGENTYVRQQYASKGTDVPLKENGVRTLNVSNTS
jgi:hypothetical protein